MPEYHIFPLDSRPKVMQFKGKLLSLRKKSRISEATNKDGICKHSRKVLCESINELIERGDRSGSGIKILVFCNSSTESSIKERTDFKSQRSMIMNELRLTYGNRRLMFSSYLREDEHLDPEWTGKSKRGSINVPFIINKMNQGMHVDDIDMSIMMDDRSKSNIMYWQRIGRMRSINRETTPVIMVMDNGESLVEQVNISRLAKEVDKLERYHMDIGEADIRQEDAFRIRCMGDSTRTLSGKWTPAKRLISAYKSALYSDNLVFKRALESNLRNLDMSVMECLDDARNRVIKSERYWS
ncbi:hypothetical protein [Coriobacterium glomerans]|uniref:hypothetical protein n=1 Tax=Coriobacterium glomerans TaxID=33871 RepID=UPI0012E9AB5E|nr:hypothetical protein [Coriobacterium glomerans]